MILKTCKQSLRTFSEHVFVAEFRRMRPPTPDSRTLVSLLRNFSPWIRLKFLYHHGAIAPTIRLRRLSTRSSEVAADRRLSWVGYLSCEIARTDGLASRYESHFISALRVYENAVGVPKGATSPPTNDSAFIATPQWQTALRFSKELPFSISARVSKFATFNPRYKNL